MSGYERYRMKYDIDPDAAIDTLAIAQEIRPFILASLQEAASRLEKGLQIVSVEPALEKIKRFLRENIQR